jgi:hypothetical protein
LAITKLYGEQMALGMNQVQTRLKSGGSFGSNTHNNHIKIAHYRSLGRSASLRAPYVSR